MAILIDSHLTFIADGSLCLARTILFFTRTTRDSLYIFRKGAVYYLKDLSITPSLCITKMHTAKKCLLTQMNDKEAKYKNMKSPYNA